MDKGSLQILKTEKSSNFFSWATCDIFLNNLNHGLIAVTTFYLTWLCVVKSDITTHFAAHTIIATLGYQVLMAEGFLVMYKRNSYTIHVESRETKTTLHWVLLAIGSVLAVVGTLWEYFWRESVGRKHG